MLRDRDFEIEITWDDAGSQVCVRHKPTALEFTERPTTSKSISRVRDELLQRLNAYLYRPEDFLIDTLRYQFPGGHVGTLMRLCHLPTGKVRPLEAVPNAGHDANEVMRNYIDEIIAELWDEGYYPRRPAS